MRSSQKSGRSRGKGNRPNKTQGHSPNRVYESAGPEGKVRGTPQQIIDKYLALARDAQLSGDRVGSENFLQHAEHYARILITAAEAAAERRDQQGGGQPQGGGHQQHGQPQQYGQPQQNGQPEAHGRQNHPNQSANVVQNGDEAGDPSRGGQGAQGGGQSGGMRRRDAQPDAMDQPDSDGLAAIDAAGGQADLVETPESRVQPREPRQRRPRRNPEAAPPAQDADQASRPAEPAATEAGAEEAAAPEKRKRKPRAPRRVAKVEDPAQSGDAPQVEKAGEAPTEAAE